jgi:hypothetical protein
MRPSLKCSITSGAVPHDFEFMTHYFSAQQYKHTQSIPSQIIDRLYMQIR